MISKDRKSFIFHSRWAVILSEFDRKVQLEVFDAVCKYTKTGTVPELSPIAKGAFAFVKWDLENDGIEVEDSSLE